MLNPLEAACAVAFGPPNDHRLQHVGLTLPSRLFTQCGSECRLKPPTNNWSGSEDLFPGAYTEQGEQLMCWCQTRLNVYTGIKM